MAKKSAVIQVVAEGTDEFNRRMDGSAKKVRDFGKSGKDAGSSLGKMQQGLTSALGVLGKFAPALAAVTSAASAFQKACETNQATGDAYNRVMAEMKTSVDNFFYAIQSGNFSAFSQGLDAMIHKAAEAQDALDQLGNSTMSLGVINAKANNEFQKQVTIMRTAAKGSAEYKAAYERAASAIGEMSTATTIVQSDQWKAMATNIAKRTGIDAGQIKFDWVLGAQTLDATADRDAIKKRAQADVEAYQAELKRLDQQYKDRKTYTRTTTYGAQETVMGNAEQMAAYTAAVTALNDKYGESIVTVTMLNQMSDEELAEVNKLTTAYYQGESQIETYRQKLARLGKEDLPKTTQEARKAAEAIKQSSTIMSNRYDSTSRTNALSSGTGMLGNSLSAQHHRGSAQTVNEEALSHIGEGISQIFGDGQTAIEEVTQSLTDQSNALGQLGNAYSSLGDAIGGTAGSIVQSLGATIQAISALVPAMEAASIAEGTETAVSSSHHWIEALSAIAAVTATVISTFASISKFEEGGVVGGSSYHGDQLLARLNSGEGVLTRQGMKNLNSMVSSDGRQGGTIDVVIRNDRLQGSIDNNNSRKAYTRN